MNKVILRNLKIRLSSLDNKVLRFGLVDPVSDQKIMKTLHWNDIINMDREELIYWAKQIDPNGVWTDQEAMAEFETTWTLQELRQDFEKWFEEEGENMNDQSKQADNMYLVNPELPIENQENQEDEPQIKEHLKRKRRRFHNEPDGINENRFEGMQEQRNTFKGVGTDNSFGGPFNTTVPGWS